MMIIGGGSHRRRFLHPEGREGKVFKKSSWVLFFTPVSETISTIVEWRPRN